MAYILPEKNTPWGSRYPAYLQSPDAMFPYAIIPTFEEVKRIVVRIEQAETSGLELPPFTIFYGLIFLQCDPKDIGILGNNTLLTGCMYLLRQYVAMMETRNAGLLTYQFGFWCFRAITLTLQVGIICHTGNLDRYLAEFGHLTHPRETAEGLTTFVSRLITEAQETGRFRELLGAKILPNGRRVFLENIGGLFNTDISFILHALWKDRKTFLYLSANYPTDGWSIMLLLFSEHMQWAAELNTDEKYKWGYLQALACRRSILANAAELAYVEPLCLAANAHRRESDITYRSSFLIDTEDARNYFRKYSDRLMATNQEPFPLSLYALHRPVVTAEVLMGKIEVDVLYGFLKALICRIWDEFDDSGSPRRGHSSLVADNDLTQALIIVFHLSKAILNPEAAPPETTRVLHVYIESDFINLVGRVLLLPLASDADAALSHSNCATTDEDHSDSPKGPSETLSHWAELLEYVETLHTRITHNFSDLFIVSYFDWLKVLRRIQSAFPSPSSLLSPPSSPTLATSHSPPFSSAYKQSSGPEWLKTLEHAWCSFGISFKFPSRLAGPDEAPPCAYPRCGTPKFSFEPLVCGSCLSAMYCSTECQQKHWDFVGYSHRSACFRRFPD
ncbi:hypothetical protein BDV93DRAFT_526968 [Ceratobasidium sp. AG-I]|nr:hypothetical protein BDV93DRAFT_526968 [Ceratobasidium sp. AG-I]